MNATAVISQQYYFASSLIAAPVAITQEEKPQTQPPPPAPSDIERLPSAGNDHAQTRRKRPTGAFVRSDGRFKVTLYGQNEGCSVPSYDRGSVFDGAISITQPDSILKIEANVSSCPCSKQDAESDLV